MANEAAQMPPQDPGLAASPQFSVIVPTRNRPGPLSACLEALTLLDLSHDRFEVIVVDDGSSSAVADVVHRFRSRLDLTLLSQAPAGPATARSAGAARARGAILAFTDDDCAPAPDWLSALAVRLSSAPHSAAGGSTVNALPDNPYAVANQWILEWLFRYYNSDATRALFLATNNLALPAARFWEIGGFDTAHFPLAAAEDRDLNDRWQQHGFGMIFAAEAVVFHARALALGGFWRQHVGGGRGSAALHRARQQRRWPRSSFVWGFHLWWPLWATRALVQTGGRRALRLAALVLLWRIAHTAGYAAEAMRSSPADRS